MDPVLTLRFTRIAPDRHRFEYRRPDGGGEAIELETHSTLQHDLIHYVVESEAGLQGSFYGLLAKVGGYAELVLNGGGALGGEVAITETLVGALTSALKSGAIDVESFLSEFNEYIRFLETRPPRWLTPAFVQTVQERMRRLDGRWRATPFGETMELEFPLRR